MHPKQHPKQLSKPNRICPLLVILLATGLSLHSAAQDLPAPSWFCGPYSSQANNAPAGSGSTITFSYDDTSASPGSTAQDLERAYVVFSTKGYSFDAQGNVSGYETTVRPSAGAQASVSWSGPPSSTGLREGGGPAAQARYYARISPRAGAPSGQAVPLNIHILGFAQCDTSDPVVGWNSAASASSGLSCSGGGLYGSADATSDLPSASYDQATNLLAMVGETISCNVFVNATAMCTAGGLNSSDGHAQSFADPSIEIDPSFTNQFYVEYSQDPLFNPVNPLALALLCGADGSRVVQLSGPTNVVYQLQAATVCPAAPAQWQNVGSSATNTTGSLYFTNPPPNGPLLFYRAQALRQGQ